MNDILFGSISHAQQHPWIVKDQKERNTLENTCIKSAQNRGEDVLYIMCSGVEGEEEARIKETQKKCIDVNSRQKKCRKELDAGKCR